MRIVVRALGFAFLGGIMLVPVPGWTAPRPVDFIREVQPILADHCVKCHGPEKVKGQLRLDEKAAAFRGGASGKIIVAGKSADSLLVQLLGHADADERMPKGAEPLSPAAIATIRAWIDQGAVWPETASSKSAPAAQKHWAFVKPLRVSPPAVKNPGWVRNPIDAFLAAGHEAHGLQPRPEAPRSLLLRRLYLDLVGVTPSRQELQAFLADRASDAYERVVDRLLADPRHGERWGRHWMDVWRYSDFLSWSDEVIEGRPHLWRWRDWIVESLNADKGYDRMIQEMLAADELAPEDPGVLRATGFLARNWRSYNGRNMMLENTIEHTSKAFLGITMNCARCHNHFFDPITQDEYYRFRAFFEPFAVRTDGLPGVQDDGKIDGVKYKSPGAEDSDRTGLVRVFDAQPDEKTFLFVRGDEKRPDKSRPLAPGVPAALGGKPLRILPVALPAATSAPDMREFVVEALLAAANREVADASKEVATLSQKPTSDALPDDLPLVAQKLAVAEAARAALVATVRAERIESSGDTTSERWRGAAEAALEAQRRQASVVAESARVGARRELARRQAQAKAAAEAAGADPESAGAELARQTKAASVKEGEQALAQAEKAVAKAEEALRLPPTTDYKRHYASYPATSTGRRLALARWIADGDNPLTARVAINHLWMRHFGKPLVPVVFDFGHRSSPPSHPQLFDWLATELVRNGWSLKTLHRLMVTSSAYRADTKGDARNQSRDPENRYVWQMNTRRMEAEAIRDSVLAIAGDLDLRRGGPDIDEKLEEVSPRRSLYLRSTPEKQAKMVAAFDGPNVAECYRRDDTIAPQQALTLLNSEFAIGKARLAARRLSQEAPEDGAFVVAAFELVLGRRPTPWETRESEGFLAKQTERLSNPKGLTRFVSNPGKSQAVFDAAARARGNLVHVLFNHDDFVSIR